MSASDIGNHRELTRLRRERDTLRAALTHLITAWEAKGPLDPLSDLRLVLTDRGVSPEGEA